MARPASRKAVSSLPAIANIDEQLDEVVMSEARILQTLRHQALQRAIGELMAARETMYLQDDGEYDSLDKVIQECIQKLQDNM